MGLKVLLILAALSSAGVVSTPVDGFQAEQVEALIYRNPTEAIHAEPRFEPEQVDPSIRIESTRDKSGHLWADVIYRNPDTGIYQAKNDRFEFVEQGDGRWRMIGSWSRWKCLEGPSADWTTKECGQ